MEPNTRYLFFEVKVNEAQTDLLLYESSSDDFSQAKELVVKATSSFSLSRIDQLIINYWLSINGMDQQFFKSNPNLEAQLRTRARNCRSLIDQDYAFKSIVRQQINCQISIEDYERRLAPMINSLLVDCCNFLQNSRKKRRPNLVILKGEVAEGRLIKKSFTDYFSCEVLFHQNDRGQHTS